MQLLQTVKEEINRCDAKHWTNDRLHENKINLYHYIGGKCAHTSVKTLCDGGGINEKSIAEGTTNIGIKFPKRQGAL